MMAESYLAHLPFPILGLDERGPFDVQPEGTTPGAQNVRAFDPLTGRLRGAQRPGIARFLEAQVNGSNAIRDLGHIAVSKAVSGATSASIRNVYLHAVAGGNIYLVTTSSATLATGGSAVLSTTTPFIFSSPLFGTRFFSDGTNYTKWVASTNTASAWTASEGTLPANGSAKPRLNCVWRNRMVQAAIVGDEHNWFMSCAGDATCWDYAPVPTYPTQACAGNNTTTGECPDIINCLIPYDNERLIAGGDHSLWLLQGDPMLNGRWIEISSVTGMAFGRPYCRDANGVIYFFGSRGGVFRWQLGGAPERISRQIEERLAQVNLATNMVRMLWADREQGVYVFITPLDGSATTNYFFDAWNGGWFPDKFATNGFNPSAVHVFDGDAPGDRVEMLGCQDGRIRYIKRDATNDDTAAIDSYVYLNPKREPMSAANLIELQATLGSASSDVNWSLHVGETAEAAFGAVALNSGLMRAGRNPSILTKGFGAAHYVKLGNSAASQTWTLESLTGQFEAATGRRQRVVS